MTPVAGTRIVLALGSTAQSAASMTIALHLAHDAQATLESVFVEDIDLLHLAGLPFTQELGRTSGALRPLQHADLEALLRRRAEQARRLITEHAVAARLEFSFRVARGTIAREAIAAAAHAEWVVVTEGSAQPVAGRPSGRATNAPVAVVLEAGTPGRRELETAVKLARRTASGVLVLLSSGKAADDSVPARETFEQAQQSHPELAHALVLPMRDIRDVLREARKHGCQAVVVSPTARDDRGEVLLRLLEQGGCPVVIVR